MHLGRVFGQLNGLRPREIYREVLCSICFLSFFLQRSRRFEFPKKGLALALSFCLASQPLSIALANSPWEDTHPNRSEMPDKTPTTEAFSGSTSSFDPGARIKAMNQMIESAEALLREEALALELPAKVDLKDAEWQRFLPDFDKNSPENSSIRSPILISTSELNQEQQLRLKFRELEKRIDSGVFHFEDPQGRGYVEPTRLGTRLAFRVILYESELAYLFIDKQDKDSALQDLARSEFYISWRQKLLKELDSWSSKFDPENPEDQERFVRGLSEVIQDFQKQNDLFSEWKKTELKKSQDLFDRRLKKYIARQNFEAGVSRQDGIDGRHVVIVWRDDHELETEIHRRPRTLSTEWWDLWWAKSYTRPTAGDITSGILAGSFQFAIGMIPSTVKYLEHPEWGFFWTLPIANFTFGTTLGIYGATYSNIVNAGKKTGLAYSLQHMAKASVVSLSFSTLLALAAPQIYIQDLGSYQFLSLTTLAVAGYLVSSAMFSNFLKSNIRQFPRFREKARKNTYTRNLRVFGKEVPLTVNQKNFEYQVLTEGPLNIVKNLDLVKWGQNLFGIPFLNLGRFMLLGLAASSTPVVLWYGSTRFPQLAQEMKLYRDPRIYGDNLPEFTKTWLLELSVRLYENTWNAARLLEPRALSKAYRDWKDKREEDRWVRDLSLKSEETLLSETPQRVVLTTQCKNWLSNRAKTASAAQAY